MLLILLSAWLVFANRGGEGTFSLLWVVLIDFFQTGSDSVPWVGIKF